MYDMKRIKRPFIKIKRLFRKRKTILPDREIEAYISQKLTRNKLQIILHEVDTINIATLKITADPEIDKDYVKGISIMSIYDRNYRCPAEEKVPLYIRPDVTRKLYDLHISDKDYENTIRSQQHDKWDVLKKVSYLNINDDNEEDINDSIKNIVVS